MGDRGKSSKQGKCMRIAILEAQVAELIVRVTELEIAFYGGDTEIVVLHDPDKDSN